MKLAALSGLSPEIADEVIKNRMFKDAVDKDWVMARKLNITAVPTLVAGERQLVGVQPYEQMVRFVKNGSE